MLNVYLQTVRRNGRTILNTQKQNIKFAMVRSEKKDKKHIITVWRT